MDKKRNILIRELMDLIDEARDDTGRDRHDVHVCVSHVCSGPNIENGISNGRACSPTPFPSKIRSRSRRAVSWVRKSPTSKYMPDAGTPTYSFGTTHESIDTAREAFRKVKDLTVKLVHGGKRGVPAGRLISRKTQKTGQRIAEYHDPDVLHHLVYTITNALEEKEREEFTRLKVIKRMKTKKQGG